jgi:hypothetical protein
MEILSLFTFVNNDIKRENQNDCSKTMRRENEVKLTISLFYIFLSLFFLLFRLLTCPFFIDFKMHDFNATVFLNHKQMGKQETSNQERNVLQDKSLLHFLHRLP